mgnify:CR=1 FL=1
MTHILALIAAHFEGRRCIRESKARRDILALALAPAPECRRMFGMAAVPRPVAPEKCS